jgi:hypothetical protein
MPYTWGPGQQEWTWKDCGSKYDEKDSEEGETKTE